MKLLEHFISSRPGIYITVAYEIAEIFIVDLL
jgi:hypothetical protein